MFVLGPTDSLSGLSSATGVEFTAVGDAIVSGVDSFQKLAQLAVPTGTAGTLIPTVAGQQTLVKYATIANSNSTVVTITLYLNGTATTSLLGQFVIPAYGRVEHSDQGWYVFDQNGFIQTAGNTGPTGATGPAGPTGPTGPTGAAGVVQAVTNSDGTISVTGTTANPVVSRPAITGDVTIAAASDVSAVVKIQGNAVITGTPTDQQALIWSATANEYLLVTILADETLVSARRLWR